MSQPLLTDFVGSPLEFQDASATYKHGASAGLSGAVPIDLVSDSVPGYRGLWDEEDYSSIAPAADTAAVTENTYWPTTSVGHFFA